jgi:hypothetical protein
MTRARPSGSSASRLSLLDNYESKKYPLNLSLGACYPDTTNLTNSAGNLQDDLSNISLATY